MDKQTLRDEHKKIRLMQNRTDAERKSREICKKLFALPEYKNAEKIMVYIAANGEVLTEEIIKKAAQDGKKLSAPVCRENFLMDAVRFCNISELKKGKFGIFVPSGEEIFMPDELDLIIAPGCVFGKNKHRVGYGKGYYDRFIKNAENAKTVGLAFGFNLLEEVPSDTFDMPLDIIITENEVIL